MKFNLAPLSTLIGLAAAALASEADPQSAPPTRRPKREPRRADTPKDSWKRQYNKGAIPQTPPKPGFEAASNVHVRFETIDITETHQIVLPRACIRGQSAVVGSRKEIRDGKASKSSFFAQEDLALEKGKEKPDTSNCRDKYVTRFVFKNGVPELADGESGKIQLPDETQFMLQVVVSDVTEFGFDALPKG
ncbi:hypothetical protein PSPO01_12725 [Paraphaeosphaeria sporulosa]